jgi:hypothetical protein
MLAKTWLTPLLVVSFKSAWLPPGLEEQKQSASDDKQLESEVAEELADDMDHLAGASS